MLVEVGLDAAGLALGLLGCFHVVYVLRRLDVLPAHYCGGDLLGLLVNHGLQVLLGAHHDGPGGVALNALVEEAVCLVEVGPAALLGGHLIIIISLYLLGVMLLEGLSLVYSDGPVHILAHSGEL
ncbi:MAG: hypothetical protein ACMG6E_05145 [Candidatus Roizmanbacteria bacterium]